MSSNQYQNLVEAISSLQKKGYQASFKVEDGSMTTESGSKTYEPEEVNIIEHHRFEGRTNVNDMAVLYAIETKDHEKGIIIDSYGTYSNQDLAEFMRKIDYNN